MSTQTKWNLEGDFLQACNCDYGCPCEFSAPPTRGDCQGTGAMEIRTGRCGEVVLDGIGWGFIAHWPKAIHLGNGTLCPLVDERATAEQREALLTILSGQLGGLPFEILAATFTTVLEPRFVPMEFVWDGRNSQVRAGDCLTIGLEPIKNPVTGAPESVWIEHGTGFIFKNAEAVSAKEMNANVEGLRFSWPDKAGFVTKVSYAN